MGEYILFWISKTIAELAVALAIVAAIGVGCLAAIIVDAAKNSKRNKREGK